MNKYIVTSALPYANGKLHIGHLAGAYLPADIFVRFLRLKNYLHYVFLHQSMYLHLHNTK